MLTKEPDTITGKEDDFVTSPARYSPTLDMSRLKDLILYISAECNSDPTFGSVKLNKILYFSDFMAYRVLGAPITGATYFKLPEGPAPRSLLSARQELLHEGRLTIEHRPYFNGVQKRPVVTSADLHEGTFSEAEQEIVDSVILYLWGKSAREVSDLSHQQPGWIHAADYADIPYEMAWLSADPIDLTDLAVAQKMANDLNR